MQSLPKRTAMVLKISTGVAVIVALLTAVYAIEQISQKTTADSSVPYSRQAATTPISKTRITLRLHFDTGRYYDAMQFEGGMIRIEEKDSVFGISPYLEADEVKVKVFKVFRVMNPEGLVAEGLSEFNEAFLLSKVPIRVGDANWGLGVEAVNIQKDRIESKQASPLSGKAPSPVAAQGFGNCCITCPPEPRVCAPAVQAPCGECCANTN